MAITTKPLNLAEKLYKRVFNTKPFIFSHVDVNQMYDLQEYVFNFLFEKIGSNTENFSVTKDAPDTFTYTSTGGYLFYNCVRFDIPAFSSIEILDNSQLYLFAKKGTITFQDDPVMSGISGDDIPAPIASSNSLVYKEERVSTNITPEQDEILITSLGYVSSGQYISQHPSMESLKDNLSTKQKENLFSLFQNLKIKHFALRNEFDSIKLSLPQIGDLKIRATTDGFGSDGLGIDAFEGWALADGRNGTVDMRGYFPMGWDERTTELPEHSENYPPLSTGGLKKVQLTTLEMPNHAHTISFTGGGKLYPYGSGNSAPARENFNSTVRINANENVGINPPSITGANGGNVAHENRPPFRAVVFIQKIA